MKKTTQSDFEAITSIRETKQLADSQGIQIEEFHAIGSTPEFFSSDISIGGEKIPSYSEAFGWKGISIVANRALRECRKVWKGISEEIPGLLCPYCSSQAFKTDFSNVAVCGAAPGWYFFYRRKHSSQEETKKIKYVIRGGTVVAVEETTPTQKTEIK